MGEVKKERLLNELVSFSEMRKKHLQDPEFKKVYDEHAFKYHLINAEIEWRKKQGKDQKDMAKLIGKTQQDISRFENGGNVTIDFVSKIFSAIGAKVIINQ